MEAENILNKWSIGKYLRKQKKLHKPDLTYETITPKPELKEYLDYLLEKGVKINKVSIGQFKLKNGLTYTGLVADDDILTNETLVEIPKSLLLTTRKAYFSELRKVYVENPKFFSAYHANSWEDHMLIVYLLREYQKGSSSEWWHLLNNLPKEIDYVIFWDEQDLMKLEDTALMNIALKYRQEYEEERDFIMSLCNKYPDLMDKNIYTADNIKWIYTHLVTRCFGKYLEYVTMVPFAELFNHECTDVFYDLKYLIDNPNAPAQPLNEVPRALEPSEEDGFDTSDGSYDSRDEEFDTDYDYDEFVSDESINDLNKKKHFLDEIEMDTSLLELCVKKDDPMVDLKAKIKGIKHVLFNYVNLGDSFSIFYFNQVLNRLKLLVDDYINKKLTYQEARNLLRGIESMNSYYIGELYKYYKEIFGQKNVSYLVTQQNNLKRLKEEEEKQKNKKKKKQKEDNESNNDQDDDVSDESDPEKYKDAFDKDEDWKEDKFDYFIMKTSWKDQFEKGSQVYFCYGRLSNRLMLLRYGMTLEYNKYDHIHLKVLYLKEFDKERDAYTLEKIKYFRLNKWKRFKLKRTLFNVDLLTYCKALYWNFRVETIDVLLKPMSPELELLALLKAKSILKDFLSAFSKTEEEHEKMLNDPSLSYHEYFTIVYKLERQRLVKAHIKGIDILIEIITRLSKGVPVELCILRVNELETDEECLRNRVFLKNYLDRLIRFNRKI